MVIGDSGLDPDMCPVPPAPCKRSWSRSPWLAPCLTLIWPVRRIDDEGVPAASPGERVGQRVISLVVAVVVGRPRHRVAHLGTRGGVLRDAAGSRFDSPVPVMVTVRVETITAVGVADRRR